MSGILNAASNISGAVSSISNAASNLDALFNGGYGARQGLGLWAASLQPASFRGIPFGVMLSTVKTGRRTALHEYPFRDEVWVEDLGLGTRTFAFRGFLVGDNVFAQRDAMIAAVETAGPGTMVHPSIGSRNVSVIDFSATERGERGRVVELEFSFIQTAKVLYPTTVAQTKSGVLNAVANVIAKMQADFQTYIAAPLAYGASVVQGAVQTVAVWRATAASLAGDAGLLEGAVDALVGNYGRYSSGAVSTPAPSTATVATVLAAAITNKAAVSTASVALGVATSNLTATTTGAFATAVYALSEALRAAAVNPADQVRLLTKLQNFSPTIAAASAPIGAAMATVQTGVATLCRRAAMASLANACAAYQPTSSNDAQTLRAAVVPLFDAEITIAGDVGQDATYLAMRAMRTAVIKDLTIRGATLPALMTVTSSEPQPALTMAYRLYQDATRADDLITRANPVHPAFMPTSFQALSS
jgi:prophage DNA circulation protein